MIFGLVSALEAARKSVAARPKEGEQGQDDKTTAVELCALGKGRAHIWKNLLDCRVRGVYMGGLGYLGLAS